MITPAYPNRTKFNGLDEDLFGGLRKQFNQYPHYIYIDNQVIYLNDQPRMQDLEKYYERLFTSPNTIVFWSSKTRLHSLKAIYRIENRTVVFDLVIDTTQNDYSWVFRMLYLGAFGVYFFLKEEVDTMKIPKKFAEPIPDKAVVEGEYVYLDLKGV